MWTGPQTQPYVRTALALGPPYVVSQGVRHVPIDVLPREVLTFRTVCGQDLVEDEHRSEEPRDCEWCRRFGTDAS